MPELPEVQALADDLRERVADRVIDHADVAEISVLKTYDPPLDALRGQTITGTKRYGKFLDLVIGAERLHLIVHLARAGWLRWRDSLPEQPPRPGKGPLAFRLRFTDGTGFDLTEAGTRKRLAVYLVTDPAAVPDAVCAEASVVAISIVVDKAPTTAAISSFFMELAFLSNIG